MTKFASIWGDLTVREESIIPVKDPKEPTKKEAAAADPKAGDAAKEEEEETSTVTTEESEEAEGAAEEKPEGEGAEEEEEEEEYEYTDDDVSKAFGMLEEEGVLELTEDDEFEASKGGLADAIAATVRNKLKKEIEAIPSVVQEFYAHVTKGGDASSFTSGGSQELWEDYDITTEENQKEILKASYLQQGMTEEEAAEEIEDIAEGKMQRKAEIAQSALSKVQKAQSKAKTAAETKRVADADKKRNSEVSDLKSDIDKLDELAGFKLDKEKKDNFKKYLFDINPRTGKSQMQENMSNPEERMRIAFLDFVNYTMADLEKEVKSKMTKTRKKKLSRFTDTSTKNKNNSAAVKTKLDKGKGGLVIPSIFGPQTIEVED